MTVRHGGPDSQQALLTKAARAEKGILWTLLHLHVVVVSVEQLLLLYFVIVLRNLKLITRSMQKSSSISKPHLLPALKCQISYIWHGLVCDGSLYWLYQLPNKVLGYLLFSAGQKCQQHRAQEPYSSLTSYSDPSNPKYASRGSEAALLSCC